MTTINRDRYTITTLPTNPILIAICEKDGGVSMDINNALKISEGTCEACYNKEFTASARKFFGLTHGEVTHIIFGGTVIIGIYHVSDIDLIASIIDDCLGIAEKRRDELSSEYNNWANPW